MPDYQQTRIYKIRGGDHIYIGGTTLTLGKRIANLHRDFKNGLGAPNIRSIMKYYNADIILIENYPCTSREELNDRVRYWTAQIECINTI